MSPANPNAFKVSTMLRPTEGRDDAPTTLPGFCGRQVLIDRYADQTGVDLSQLDYYRCFNHWKSVCIVQGVYARYRHGRWGP